MNIIEAIGRIDYSYWILGELNKALKHRTPLDKMIDAATGFNKAQIGTAVGCLAEIVKCKKAAGYEYDKDAEILKALRKLKRESMKHKLIEDE